MKSCHRALAELHQKGALEHLSESARGGTLVSPSNSGTRESSFLPGKKDLGGGGGRVLIIGTTQDERLKSAIDSHGVTN